MKKDLFMRSPTYKSSAGGKPCFPRQESIAVIYYKP